MKARFLLIEALCASATATSAAKMCDYEDFVLKGHDWPIARGGLARCEVSDVGCSIDGLARRKCAQAGYPFVAHAEGRIVLRLNKNRKLVEQRVLEDLVCTCREPIPLPEDEHLQ